MLGVMLGAGVLIGLALACTASAIALAVGSRAVPAGSRSLVLGAITASARWAHCCPRRSASGCRRLRLARRRAGLPGAGARHVPAAWIAGRVDRLPLPAGSAGRRNERPRMRWRAPSEAPRSW
jgi:hypothetical protein